MGLEGPTKLLFSSTSHHSFIARVHIDSITFAKNKCGASLESGLTFQGGPFAKLAKKTCKIWAWFGLNLINLVGACHTKGIKL